MKKSNNKNENDSVDDILDIRKNQIPKKIREKNKNFLEENKPNKKKQNINEISNLESNEDKNDDSIDDLIDISQNSRFIILIHRD